MFYDEASAWDEVWTWGMSMRLSTGLLLAAVAVGCVASAHAADHVIGVEEGFAQARKHVVETVAQMNNEKKLREGLSELGFHVRRHRCESPRFASRYRLVLSGRDGSVEVVMDVENYDLFVDGAAVVVADSAGAFLAQTGDLEKIRELVEVLKAGGIVPDAASRTPVILGSCRLTKR